MAARVVTFLRATGLTHAFGGLTALRDVDLAIDPGDLLGIIGPNGSGKTTLVDAITGVLRPHSGSVDVAGADVTGRGAVALARLGVTRTFQGTRLMDPLTVFDNVMLGLHAAPIRGRRRRRIRVEATLAALGLEQLSARAVGELSHGQRRRVELGRAMVGDPRGLVLDEPTSGLFGPDAWEVAHLIAAVAGRGVAVCMVEHDLGVVAEVCTRVVVIDGGVIVDAGLTADVLRGAAVAALSGELGRDRLAAASA